jgi:hypothetical protein
MGKGSPRPEIFNLQTTWPMPMADGSIATVSFYGLVGYFSTKGGTPKVAEILKGPEQVAWLTRDELVSMRDQISAWLDKNPAPSVGVSLGGRAEKHLCCSCYTQDGRECCICKAEKKEPSDQEGGSR